MRVVRRLGWVVLLAYAGLAAALPDAAASDTVYVRRSATGFPTYTTYPLEGSTRSTVIVRAASDAPRGLQPGLAPRTFAGADGRRLELAQVLPLVQDLSRRHQVSVPLVLAIIDVESGFRPDALSTAGAMGLMQLMPATARRFGVTNPWDAGANVEGGIRYLRFLLDLFGGDLSLALAAYNAGEAAVERYRRQIPPFSETQRYVPAVLARYRHWKQVVARSGSESGSADGGWSASMVLGSIR